MDSSPLLDSQILEGRRFLERFAADGNAILAAFWVQESESGDCSLYVVSDLVDRVGPRAAIEAIHASMAKLHLAQLSSSDIKATRTDHPLVKDVLRLMKSPVALGIWKSGLSFRSVVIERIYIYPPSSFTFTQVHPMTTEDIGQEILQHMSRNRTLPAQVALKDGTAFVGVPFSLELSSPGSLQARFVTDGELTPRLVRLDEIASFR